MKAQKPLPILAALESDPQLQARIDAVEDRVKRTLEIPALRPSAQTHETTQHDQPTLNPFEPLRSWRLR